MADGSKILNSPILKNFSLDCIDIPSIKSLNAKTVLVYEGARIKWTNDLESLKNFVENIIGLDGRWKSPGGKSKQFVSSDFDLVMTWHPGKQNTLLFNGKDGELVRKFLISTLNTSTDTLNRMSVEFITHMNNEATTKPNVLFEDDTPSDQHYSKVRPKPIYQESSSISQCDCKCGLLAAEIEGIKLDMVIMQRNIESKMQSNKIRESDESKRLEQELYNAREECKNLKGDIQILITGRNNEIADLNQTIVSLENSLKTSKALNVSLSGQNKRLEQDLVNAREKCKHLEDDIQVLMSGRNNEIADVNQTVVSLENKLKISEALNASLSGKIASINALKSTKAKQRENYTALPNSNKVAKGRKQTKRINIPNDIDSYTVVDGDCVNQMKRNDKRSSRKKDTKSEYIHRIKEVNNNNLRPSYFPKWVSQLPLISFAADPRRYGKVKPPIEYVSVPADIDSYTVVDGNLEISQKELPRVKSRSGQKFFRNNSCHFTLNKNT